MRNQLCCRKTPASKQSHWAGRLYKTAAPQALPKNRNCGRAAPVEFAGRNSGTGATNVLLPAIWAARPAGTVPASALAAAVAVPPVPVLAAWTAPALAAAPWAAGPQAATGQAPPSAVELAQSDFQQPALLPEPLGMLPSEASWVARAGRVPLEGCKGLPSQPLPHPAQPEPASATEGLHLSLAAKVAAAAWPAAAMAAARPLPRAAAATAHAAAAEVRLRGVHEGRESMSANAM